MSLESDSLLAVTGLAPDEVTPDQALASREVPLRFAQRLRRWLTADQQPFRYVEPPKDLEAWFRKLALPVDQLTVQAWLEGVGDPLLGAEYYVGLMRARDHVITTWPKVAIESLAGPQIMPLSADDAGDVWAVLSVLEDPMRLLDEFDSHTLEGLQVAAFGVAYPALWDHAKQAIQAATIDHLARHPKWTPDPEKEQVMNVLLGRPPEDPVRQPAPPPPPSADFALDPAASRTQAEVSAAPRGPAAVARKA